ncbi:MAG: hypothetical protein AB1765_04005 [Candidatus Hydrogenedentota bacterium]
MLLSLSFFFVILPLASFVIFLFRYLASCFYLILLELECFSEEMI